MASVQRMTARVRFLVCLALSVLFFSVFNFNQLSAADKEETVRLNKADKSETEKNFLFLKPSEQYRLFQLNLYLSRFYLYLQSNFSASPPFTGLKLNLPRFSNHFRLPDAKERQKRFGRAMVLGLGHIVYATSSYWIRQDVMKEDWEYHFTWEDQKRRFLFSDGFRFDSNTFQFNWTHSMAGAMYYNYARANNFNKLESFLYTFGVSYFWEFVVEFKEVVSINDSIATPIGGVSIGESLFQLGRFFRSRKPTFLNRIARFLSNPILTLNTFLDRKRSRIRYAFDDDYWYDCRLAVGPRFDTLSGWDSNSFFHVGLESQIINVPEYGMPGVFNRGVTDTLATEFNISGTFNKRGIYEYDILARSVLFGYFMQNIRSVGSGEDEDEVGHGFLEDIDGSHRVGYSFFLGAASAFELTQKNPGKLPAIEPPGGEDISDLPDREDKYAVINLLGPTFDFAYFNKDLKIRLVADAYGDFALIHSNVFKKYSQVAQFGQTKSTLENHGYYYALGVTLSSMLQVNYSTLEFRGKVKYHYFDSIEGMDRFQKDVAAEDDFDLKDQRLTYNLSLGFRIPNTPLQLVLGLEQLERWGAIEDFSQHNKERRSYFQLKYIF
jgi:hypothetical protein